MKAFLVLVAAVTIPTFFISYTLKMKGLSQRYQRHQHTLNQRDFYLVARSTRKLPPNSIKTTKAILSLHPQILVWLDINQTKDGVFIANDQEFIKTRQGQPLPIGFWTWHDLQEKNFPRLSELLKAFPATSFVLNVKANHKKIDLQLADLIEKEKASDRALITSSIGIVVQSLRKLKPAWLFGIDLAEFTRLAMFDSLDMAPVVPVKGDIFIAQQKIYQRSISKTLVDELHRRKKRIIAQSNNIEEWSSWREKNVDGLLTDEPENFLPLIKKESL